MTHRLTVFEDSYDAFIKEQKQKALRGKPTELDEIVTLIRMMQDYKMDDHCGIAGQNGVGKTYGSMMLMKKYFTRFMKGESWMQNMMLAKHTTDDVIDFILNNKKTLCGIDELNQYLNYKKHADSEQVHLIEMMELARSNSIGFVGNIRDPRKLTLNYRQGKLSIVVWTIDRYIEGGSYAALFVANPSVESRDKFGFSRLSSDIQSFAELRAIMENEIPTFVNYVRIPNVSTVLSKKEIDDYEALKDTAMAHAHMNHCMKEFRKKKLDFDELKTRLDRLRKKLGDALVDNALSEAESKLKAKKQKELKEWLEED